MKNRVRQYKNWSFKNCYFVKLLCFFCPTYENEYNMIGQVNPYLETKLNELMNVKVMERCDRARQYRGFDWKKTPCHCDWQARETDRKSSIHKWDAGVSHRSFTIFIEKLKMWKILESMNQVGSWKESCRMQNGWTFEKNKCLWDRMTLPTTWVAFCCIHQLKLQVQKLNFIFQVVF